MPEEFEPSLIYGLELQVKTFAKKKRRGTYLIFLVIYFPNMLGRFWLWKTCSFRTFGWFLSRKYFDMCICFVAQFYPLSLIIFSSGRNYCWEDLITEMRKVIEFKGKAKELLDKKYPLKEIKFASWMSCFYFCPPLSPNYSKIIFLQVNCTMYILSGPSTVSCCRGYREYPVSGWYSVIEIR